MNIEFGNWYFNPFNHVFWDKKFLCLRHLSRLISTTELMDPDDREFIL